MKLWKKCKEQPWFSYSVAICIGILFYTLINNLSVIGGVLYSIWAVLKPLIYGLILAYLIDPLARFYQHKPLGKMKKEAIARNLSVIFALLTVVIALGGLGAAVVPQLVKSVVSVFNELSDTITNIENNSGSLAMGLPLGLDKYLANISVSETILEGVGGFVTSNLSNIATVSSTVGNGFANFLIAFILCIYYMMDKERLKVQTRRVVRAFLHNDEKYDTFHDFCVRADKILLKYISCNLLEAFIVGVANAVLMLIFGMPYVLLISVVVGITNLAPTFGPIVGALIGALMLVLEKPIYALIFLIFTVVIQTIDGYIIKPKLFGDTLGVSSLLILMTIIVGGRLFGVVGILLAIPFAAIAQYVFDETYKRRRARKDKKVLDIESS